jgi:hypothetical protein
MLVAKRLSMLVSMREVLGSKLESYAYFLNFQYTNQYRDKLCYTVMYHDVSVCSMYLYNLVYIVIY